MVTSGATVSDLTKRNTRTNWGSKIPLAGISDDGLLFLKSVFAAPDFAAQGNFSGIPDGASQKQSSYTHIAVGDFYRLAKLDKPKPEESIIVLQLPVPGVAFYVTKISPGNPLTNTTLFEPVYYDDFEMVFNQNPQATWDERANTNKNMTNFRFAGNSIELICTSNATSWTGNVRAFKARISEITTDLYANAATNRNMTYCLDGAEGVGSTSTSTYFAPSNLGVYMTAVDEEATFKWTPVKPNAYSVNLDTDTTNLGSGYGVFARWYTGCGNLQTNVIILEGTSDTNFGVRAWSVMEYRPNNGTAFEKNATASPKKDNAVLEIYKRLATEMPVAVSYFDNAGIWSWILSALGKGWSMLKDAFNGASFSYTPPPKNYVYTVGQGGRTENIYPDLSRYQQ